MRLLLFLMLSAQAALGAVGDVLVTILPDGKSCDVFIEGFAAGAAVNMARTTDGYKTATANTPYFVATSFKPSVGGGTSTTTRVVHINDVQRKPYPDNTLRDEDTTTLPGYLRLRFSLSMPVYAADDTGPGASGQAVQLFAPAGWITNIAGGSEGSAVQDDVSVTNNSALAYPKAIGQWDWATVLPFTRKTGTFTVGYRATHAFGIQAVVLDAVGVTSAATVTSTVTAPSKVGPSADGLYYDSYIMSVPLTAFTQGEQIRLRARVYSNVGDTTSVIDTETYTAIRADGLGRVEVTCDKTGALVSYGVVKTAAAGGNDTTGATSTSLATARTTPYATVAEAINDNATVVVLTDDDTGSHAWTQSPVKSQAYCIEVVPDPEDVAANITLTVDVSTSSVRCKHLMLSGGFNVVIGTGSFYFDGDANTYESTFIANGVGWSSGSSVADVLDFRMANFVNVNASSYRWKRFGSVQCAWNAVGCRLSGTGNVNMDSFGTIVACSMGNNFAPLIGSGSTNNAQRIQRNIAIDFNRLDRWTPATALQFFTIDSLILSDFSMRGNLIVNSGTHESDNFFANDTAFDNFLFRHNTIQGMPFAGFYDTSTPADVRSNLFFDGNALYRLSVKTDVFSPPDGTRTGNWWAVFGTAMRNNRVDGSVSFLPEWFGNNSALIGTIGNYNELGYTTDNSRVGAGGGGGDYTPTSGSVLRNAMPASEAFILFDLLGTDIPSSGTMDIGAVLNSPPPTDPDPPAPTPTLSTGSLTVEILTTP